MFLWLAFTASLAAAKAPDLSPSLEEFQAACIEHRVGAESVSAGSELRVGEVGFEPVASLERLQSTFSFDRVVKGMKELPKKDLKVVENGGLPYDRSSSVYPSERMISVIRYKGRLYILDGHHRALVSIYLGAKTIPVKLVADWSYKSRSKFFADLKARDLSYFYDLDGVELGPGEFCEMIDDPYLYLARKLLRRVDFTYDPETEEIEILKKRGSKFPIGIKLNRDVPFTEQEISRRLRANGVEWKKGDRLTLKMLREFLSILEYERDSSRLAQLLLLDRPTPVRELELKELIRAHFQRVQCEYQTSGGDLD